MTLESTNPGSFSNPERTPSPVECQRGIEQSGQGHCLEDSLTTLVLPEYSSRTHAVIPPSAQNPSLSNYLGYPDNDNHVVLVLRSLLQFCTPFNIGTHFGFYFLSYRLFRVWTTLIQYWIYRY